MNTPAPNKAQPRKLDAASHSPLPWRIRQSQTVGEAQQGERIECDCGFVCTLETRRYEANLTSESINESERKANAKLIVRAVNHADKLAEALRPFVEKPSHLQTAQEVITAYNVLTAYKSEVQP